MGLVRKAALGTIVAPAAALGYLHVTTTVVSPLAPTDAIFSSEPYKRYNVNRNATTNDVCFKSVSLNRIRPELLKNDGDLALELCRGVWSGWGECRASLPDAVSLSLSCGVPCSLAVNLAPVWFAVGERLS